MAIMEGMAFSMTVFGDKPTACIHEKVAHLTNGPWQSIHMHELERLSAHVQYATHFILWIYLNSFV